MVKIIETILIYLRAAFKRPFHAIALALYFESSLKSYVNSEIWTSRKGTNIVVFVFSIGFRPKGNERGYVRHGLREKRRPGYGPILHSRLSFVPRRPFLFFSSDAHSQ